jgi:hypothetical protein
MDRRIARPGPGGPVVTRRLPPTPPADPTHGQTCDAGRCDSESVGWRSFTDLKQWLPCCPRCISAKGVPPKFRRYDHEHEGGRS